MQSPSTGRNKAQAPPVTGPDLGLIDVCWRRGNLVITASSALPFLLVEAPVLPVEAPAEAAAPPGAAAGAAGGGGGCGRGWT